MRKEVMCGHPGCRNKFTIETERGEPAVPYCHIHVKLMRRVIEKAVQRQQHRST